MQCMCVYIRIYIYTRIFDDAQAAADRIQQLHDGFPG